MSAAPNEPPPEGSSGPQSASGAANAARDVQAATDAAEGRSGDSELRARLDARIRDVMLLGLQDAELFDEPGAERINQWVDWVLDTVLNVLNNPKDQP